MGSKTVTISDVAREAGLSKAAVSAALSGKESTISLPEATRARVLETAKRLNYTPNIFARSMVQQRSFLLGLLICEVNTGVATELIRGIQEIAADRDYAPVVFSHSSAAEESENLDTCLKRRVDGLIINTAVGPASAKRGPRERQADKAGLPRVEVFGRARSPWVVLDQRAAGRMATEHLLGLGHRRIALLTHAAYEQGRLPTGEHWDAWEHFAGYESAMSAAGLTPRVLTHALIEQPRPELHWVEQACELMKPLLAGAEAPTAVVCYDDHQAFGVIRACRELDVAVPEQLSVIGHMDASIAQLARPALTTLRVPVRQVGRQAAQMVFDLLDKRSVSNVSFEPELIVRASTAAPRH